MVSNWEEKELSDIAEVVDSRHKTPSYSDSGFPMVRAVNIKGGALNLEGTNKVSEEVYNDFSRGRNPEVGDIIISRVGHYCGAFSYVKSNEKFCLGQNTAFILPKEIDSQFLYYQLVSPIIKIQIEKYAVGAAQKTISLKSIRQFKIKNPPLSEQKAIAHILSSLDDKIELNRQMNETLEAMSQALFKSWFVDFDPVIDNALAAGNDIPDAFAKRAEQRKGIEKEDSSDIQDLFPDEFEFTEEMGWIPKGWEVTPVYDVAEFINGSSFKSQYFSDENEGLPIIKIAEIKNGVSQQTKFTTQEMPEKYFIEDGSILFSWSGNPDTSIDTFIWTGGEGWLNQHIFNVVLHKNSDRTFVYYLLKMLKPVFTEIARDKQTTGLGHVTIKDMKRTYTIKPSALALEAFELNSNPIFERWYQNLFSSRELAKLRDTLLPKLMSGELRITDAAALVDEVL